MHLVEVFDIQLFCLLTVHLKYSIARTVALKISFINILEVGGSIYKERAKASASDLPKCQLIPNALKLFQNLLI